MQVSGLSHGCISRTQQKPRYMVGAQYICIGEWWVGTDNALNLEISWTLKLISGPAETAYIFFKHLGIYLLNNLRVLTLTIKTISK